ncbi:hypothetical protein ACFLSI_01540 [Bacteroidota bacterium]
MNTKKTGIVYFALLILVGLLISCSGSSENKKDIEKPSEKELAKVKKLDYDALTTEVAKYIAGMDCEDERFKLLQKKSFYSEHYNFIESAWDRITDSTMVPLKSWLNENNFFDDSDTTTLLYPFAGPDFLYAHVFYPKTKTKIMFGLERLGTVPNLLGMTDAELSQYLEDIRGSLKYLNQSGYFVTSHMGTDFSKRNLNGNIHMLLYFLARTNHKIIKVIPIYLDNNGNAIESPDYDFKNNISGLKIEYCDSDAISKKTVYYFKGDVSDEKLATKPGFAKFINKYPDRVAFFKAASYILFNPNFNIVKQLTLDCKKIIQDDSGLSHKDLTDSNFDYKMYGTYTGTIKQIPWAYQKDLEKALKESGNNYDLPFKISYNMHNNEGMLMIARKK